MRQIKQKTENGGGRNLDDLMVADAACRGNVEFFRSLNFMKQVITIFAVLILSTLFFDNASAQIGENSSSQTVEQTSNEFLGIKMRPEIQAIINEIERKAGVKIRAEFIRQKQFTLGSSYISEDGVPVVLVDDDLKNEPNKLEAVIAHELLHLRLRVGGYPTFLFAESVNTARGRAIDTEQDTLDDVTSLIEHQVFKADMEKFGLYQYVNLAGDTAAAARKNSGREDGQTDAINYARAILEYQRAEDIEEVRKIYAANKWTRSQHDGEFIARIIKTSNIRTPREVDAVFVRCLSQLFPLPGSAYNYKLTLDPNKKVGRQMIVSISRRAAVNKKRS